MGQKGQKCKGRKGQKRGRNLPFCPLRAGRLPLALPGFCPSALFLPLPSPAPENHPPQTSGQKGQKYY